MCSANVGTGIGSAKDGTGVGSANVGTGEILENGTENDFKDGTAEI